MADSRAPQSVENLGGERTFTASAKSRRSAMCRPKMHAWAIRKERHGPPESSMQLEVVPTWPIGEDEVLVYVMAAGVNYNGVWAGLGEPISPLDVHKQSVPHRGLRRRRRGLGGRRQGAALEGRRRGHRPLQSGRRRRRGLQRRRSAAVALAAHLGLRDAGRLVRAVLPRAVAPADAEAQASAVGGGGLLHAHARHRLPHAVRPSAAHAEARRQRAGVGRLRRARRVRRAACRRVRRQRDRRHLRRIQARLRDGPRRRGRHQPQGLQVLGPDAARSTRPSTTTGSRRRASSARRSGTSPASATSTSCSSIRARRRSRCHAWW